ncbi:hypothetical protein B0J14DRAFT_677485 [Halenospora varia]|nr:hypothetical protein B0J14DRAFT_677485 [Halenospora varia]
MSSSRIAGQCPGQNYGLLDASRRQVAREGYLSEIPLSQPPSYTTLYCSSNSTTSLQQTNKVWSRRRGNADSHRSWKPKTLQAPILGSFIALSLGFIVLLEILSFISSRPSNGGGLAFAHDIDGISLGATWGYLYFPTILAVIYSIIWSWIDLDVKRLEPWFQLSAKGGATSRDSVELQYPFDLLPFIPWNAFRRKSVDLFHSLTSIRHWGVFFSGTIMLMVFWIITPLQSAIFTTSEAIRSIPIQFNVTSQLLDVRNQSQLLDNNFMNTAYAISWLNQSLPAFAAADYVVPSFRPANPAQGKLSWSGIYHATIDAYSTNLTCSPAKFYIPNVNTKAYTFDNGVGCVVPSVPLPAASDAQPNALLYVPWYPDPHLDWYLETTSCPRDFQSTFLAVFATNQYPNITGVYKNVTALSCTPSYHVQSMEVVVNASSGAIIRESLFTPRGELRTLPPNVFNTSNFEYLIGVGRSPIIQRGDYAANTILEQSPRTEAVGIAWPTLNMAGFAYALSNSTMQQMGQWNETSWSEPEYLRKKFEVAHQLLFATAFQASSEPVENASQILTGKSVDQRAAIVLVRPIAIALEVALGIISALGTMLWYYSYCRTSKLLQDPAAILDVMAALPNDKGSGGGIEQSRFPSESSSLGGDDTKLVLRDNGVIELIPEISGRSTGLSMIKSLEGSSVSENEKRPHSFVRPAELRLPVGFLLSLSVTGGIAAVLFFRQQSLKGNGILLPSANPVVLSVLENYLPTAFATLLEPAWVILNRFLCVLKPWDELRKGNAVYSKSIGVKYTSLPPQLSFWRAYKSSHFLLATLGIVSLSTNILAVAFSGLFQEKVANIFMPDKMTQRVLPQINITEKGPVGTKGTAITYQDHFYMLNNNIVNETPLLPWVDKHNYYLPFVLPNPNFVYENTLGPTVVGYRSSAIGFGADYTCSEIPNSAVSFTLDEEGSNGNITFDYSLPGFDNPPCNYTQGPFPTFYDGFKESSFSPNNTKLALEGVLNLGPELATHEPDNPLCQASIATVWARSRFNSTLSLAANATRLDPMTSTWISCTPRLRIARYDISVDTTGRVKESTRTSPFETDMSPFLPGNNGTTELVLLRQIGHLMRAADVNRLRWHNDTFTSDWMNMLIVHSQNFSRSVVDPAHPLTAAEELIPLLSSLYSQLFALVLGLNTDAFAEIPKGDFDLVPVTVVMTHVRIFVSETMAWLAVGLLSFQLIVALVFYARRPKPFLTRMPTSLGAIISYVGASRIVKDLHDGKGDEVREGRYGYGRYVGTDGETHVGVEKQRFVVPMDVVNPEARRKKLLFAEGPFGLWRRKTGESEVKSWI